jgi:UDP-N-acetyl-D-mannosaminuronate dehydrogenase
MRKARVGVIGLAYVGLPLAVEFARAGFDVTGFDVHPEKVAVINAGRSYVPDVPPADLAAAVANPYDCAVVAPDHDAFDYARLAAMPLVVDTRNALQGFDRASILRL